MMRYVLHLVHPRRRQRELEEGGIGPLLEELREIDPEAAGRLHPADEKRILRALEVYGKRPPRYDCFQIQPRAAYQYGKFVPADDILYV